jgi:hypothetical protein
MSKNSEGGSVSNKRLCFLDFKLDLLKPMQRFNIHVARQAANLAGKFFEFCVGVNCLVTPPMMALPRPTLTFPSTL